MRSNYKQRPFQYAKIEAPRASLYMSHPEYRGGGSCLLVLNII
jgi:hypothetical protein